LDNESVAGQDSEEIGDSSERGEADRSIVGQSDLCPVSKQIKISSYSKVSVDRKTTLHVDESGETWYYCLKRINDRDKAGLKRSEPHGKLIWCQMNNLFPLSSRHNTSTTSDSILSSGTFDGQPNFILLRGKARGFIFFTKGHRPHCWDKVQSYNAHGEISFEFEVEDWIGGRNRFARVESFFSDVLSILVLTKAFSRRNEKGLTILDKESLFIDISCGKVLRPEDVDTAAIIEGGEPEFLSSLSSLCKYTMVLPATDWLKILNRENLPIPLVLDIY